MLGLIVWLILLAVLLVVLNYVLDLLTLDARLKQLILIVVGLLAVVAILSRVFWLPGPGPVVWP